jgi:hypothetical protein
MTRQKKAYLALFLIASLTGTIYYGIASGLIKIPDVIPPPDGDSGETQRLTFLDQAIYAFSVTPITTSSSETNNYWREYSFGTTVPSNAIMAFCMIKCTTASDIMFQLSGISEPSPGWVVYSMGADNAYFDGSVFAYVPVNNRRVMAKNAQWTDGAACTVDISVVGYITQENGDHGFYLDLLSQDNTILSGGASRSWSQVDSPTQLGHAGSGFQLVGVYIALDCSVDQNVYFRKKGSTSSGLVWEPDPNDPGTHLLGIIPVSESGSFEYYTSSGSPVTIYLEGFVFQCPISNGDKIKFSSGTRTTLTADGVWHAGPNVSAKAVFSMPLQSPGGINTYKVRSVGGSNSQLWIKKNTCGIYAVLTPLSSGRFDYWSDARGLDRDRGLYVGTVRVEGS